MSHENYKSLENDELKKLAEIGIVEAQVEYGYRFLHGTSEYDMDLNEAFKWFKLASEKNDPQALFNLATMYKMGLGTEKDVNKAFSLYLDSAKKGLSAAQYYVGEMYQKGIGTECNDEEALKWIVKSYTRSNPKNSVAVGS